MKRKQKSIEDLELGVVPRSTFLQNFFHPFRKKDPVFDYKWHPTLEEFAMTHEHRMALIRTIATSINVIATMCVRLRVFKVI